MKLTIIIGQVFGLLPVVGVSEKDSSKIRFTIFSWRCLYSCLTIMGQSTFMVFCILSLVKNTEESLSSNTSIVFYSTNCLITVFFLRIATRWPRLCRQIAKVEAIDPNPDNTLVRKCNAACIITLSLAALEHVFADISGLSGALDCPTGKHLYEAFITTSFPWIYSFITYNDLLGPITQIINLQCTFNWNFSDVFVICVSFFLTSRLEQVNKRIVAVKGKYVPSTFWRSIREDYCRAASLVRKVDDVIGGIIFISFANNLFFICLQMLHTFAEGVSAKPSCKYDAPDERLFRGYEQAIYFVYSCVFLVARSLAVSLIAAQVHTASTKPAQALYRVSSSAYCVEIQRLLDQIHMDTVALSGIQFFNVTRGLVLTVAGTIVTYELVLMQFTGVSPTSASPTVPSPT
ncbi:gustatory receptor for sugar taste 64e-like [Ostrinia nubilalis]|uniref:gustatory receptor for sugar taste 64e-like n=1 Tax=Ostrinia nubilalis TaxID=29057 RepID=UPI003082600B